MQVEEFDSSDNRQDETYDVQLPSQTDTFEETNKNQLSNRNDESHLIQIKASKEEVGTKKMYILVKSHYMYL